MHPHQRPARAADVEEWHAGEVHRCLIELPRRRHKWHQLAQVGVGQHRALGQAGGTRGVELHRNVFACHRRERVLLALARHPALVAFVLGVVAEGDDLLHRVESRLDLLEIWEELLPDKQHFRLGVVDDELDLRRREPPVDGDADGIELAPAVEHLEVLRTVLVEERDAFLRAHPLGRQALRDAIRSRVHLAVGDSAVAVGDHGLVTPLSRVAPDALTQRPLGRRPLRYLSLVDQRHLITSPAPFCPRTSV